MANDTVEMTDPRLEEGVWTLSPEGELVRTEMCGAYPLDPPLAVDVGVGEDWNEAK